MDMSTPQIKSGFAKSGNAKIYYQLAGIGQPLIMIHAGVADSRQWENEFAAFSKHLQVLRYDMRAYGKSTPVPGGFTHLQDLTALIDQLGISLPVIIMGCSMGGGLAMDFALMYPSKVKALIMVASGPSGLELDLPRLSKFDLVELAFNEGDLDLVAELETQIWFDGTGRTPDQVNPAMRQLAFDMNRLALSHEIKQLAERLPDAEVPAVGRLSELLIPVQVIVGAHDIPYMQAAADYMAEKIPSVRVEIMADAAHLPNMDHPDQFRRMVGEFLDQLTP
jgi:pimeloyl-ACP methyl ester carboxylesterase